MKQRKNNGMRLLVCIGNTRTQVCAQAGPVEKIAAFPTTRRNYAHLVKSVLTGSPQNIGCVGVVSVVPWAESTWIRACKDESTPVPLFLNALAAKTLLAVKYHPVASLGADRVCTALGAICRAPRRDRIVVDAGTAVTIDAITRDNTFQGGFIFPGPNLTRKALSSGTALLPASEWKNDGLPIGRATQECINQGVLNMFTGGVIRCIGSLKEELHLKDPVIFVTGGAAEALRLLKDQGEIVMEPDLVFLGLEYWLNNRASRRSC